ncbi:MAG TPA: hypothetical protein VM618_11915 [Acidimicrobiia bacterium]|nr:hypothetical protein [Acidimicrobiia bacterium]
MRRIVELRGREFVRCQDERCEGVVKGRAPFETSDPGVETTTSTRRPVPSESTRDASTASDEEPSAVRAEQAGSASTGHANKRSHDGAESDEALGAELRHSCLRPGGEQALIVETRPGAEVIYQAVYADGNSPWDYPNYYGGSGSGIADDAGRFRRSWRVEPGAPPGDVQVDVVAKFEGSREHVRTNFAIAGPDGKCAVLP